LAAVNPLAEKCHRHTCHGHAECARVNGQPHRGGRNAIGAREQGKNGLRGEKIDKGEKGDVPDQEAAGENANDDCSSPPLGLALTASALRAFDTWALLIFVDEKRQLGGPATRRGAKGSSLWDVHILWSFLSCSTSAERSVTAEWPVFFHQCDVSLVSRATSPVLCTIGTAQLLAYSVIVPWTI
jgi:hypothetical protein